MFSGNAIYLYIYMIEIFGL